LSFTNSTAMRSVPDCWLTLAPSSILRTTSAVLPFTWLHSTARWTRWGSWSATEQTSTPRPSAATLQYITRHFVPTWKWTLRAKKIAREYWLSQEQSCWTILVAERLKMIWAIFRTWLINWLVLTIVNTKKIWML